MIIVLQDCTKNFIFFRNFWRLWKLLLCDEKLFSTFRKITRMLLPLYPSKVRILDLNIRRKFVGYFHYCTYKIGQMTEMTESSNKRSWIFLAYIFYKHTKMDLKKYYLVFKCSIDYGVQEILVISFIYTGSILFAASQLFHLLLKLTDFSAILFINCFRK